MKHIKSRAAALLLVLAMVLSMIPMAFAAEEFPDMPAEDDPSYAAVKSAVDNGIMTGDNGMLKLEDNILRSTVSKMLAVAFAGKGEADMSGFSDVDADKWYAEWLAKANYMGIMTGDSGKMDPSRNVTLQEVATMLVRVLGLPLGTAEDLAGVPGAGSVSSWAIPAVAALVKAGYISDVSDAGLPMNRLTFAEVLYNVSGKGNYASEGEITTDVDGNIVITADGVSLKGITVTGDIIIADGVDAGSIVLDDVTVTGRVVVRGAGVEMKNGTTAAATVVAAPAGETTVTADADSNAGNITVTGTDGKVADKVTVNAPNSDVAVSSAANEVEIGDAKQVITADGVKTTITGTVEDLVVPNGAQPEITNNGTIKNVTTNEDVAIAGTGTVENKTGSGTVTDGSGTEVGGSDEPADIPDVPDLGTSAAPPSVVTPGEAPDEADEVDLEEINSSIPASEDDLEEGEELGTDDEGNTTVTTEPSEDAEEHECDFTGEPRVITAAGCTTVGKSVVTCKQEGCGATQTTYIAATGHTAKEAPAAPDKYVAGNCLGAGYASYGCKDCSVKNVNVVTSGKITIGEGADAREIDLDQQDHEAGENPVYVTITVGEGQQGHAVKCVYCKTNNVPGTDSACAPAADATYTKTASKHGAKCETCGTMVYEAHDEESAEVEAVAPTCTTAGVKGNDAEENPSYKCATCGYTKLVADPATGHEWGEWTEEGAPEGKLIRNCAHVEECGVAPQVKPKPATTEPEEPDEGDEEPEEVECSVNHALLHTGQACSTQGCTKTGNAAHDSDKCPGQACSCGVDGAKGTGSHDFSGSGSEGQVGSCKNQGCTQTCTGSHTDSDTSCSTCGWSKASV